MSTTKKSSDKFEQLENLSTSLTQSLNEIAIGASNVIQNSYTNIFSGFSKLQPHYWQLGKLALNWQLSLEQRKKSFFFGFKRKSKNDNSMKAEISFELFPFDDPLPIFDEKKIAFRWAVPPFLELDPPDNLVQKVNEEDHSKILWIKTGVTKQNLLAIVFHEKWKKSKLYYFETQESHEVDSEKSNLVPLSWFEEIFKSLTPWITGEYQQIIAINPKTTDVQINTILNIFSNNFIVANNELTETQNQIFKAKNKVAHTLVPFYQVHRYKANIELRLNSEEKISTENVSLTSEAPEELKKKGLDLFQLGIQLDGQLIEDIPQIVFKIYPPDFLVAGDLFEAFLSAILEEEDRFDKFINDLKIDREVFTKAIQFPPPHTFIFRIEKLRKRDKEIIVLPIKEKGLDGILVFSAEFEVDAINNKVQFDSGKVKNLLKTQNNQVYLDGDGVKYFLRLFSQINRWKNKIVRFS